MAKESEKQEGRIIMKVSEQEYQLLEHKQNDYEGYTMMTHGKPLQGGVLYKETILRASSAAVHTIYLPGFKLRKSVKDSELSILYR